MASEKIENLLIKEMVIIHKYLMKMGARKEDAEDIVQDTLCKAIEYADSLKGAKVSSWLFKVAINSYYNLYNKQKREQIGLDDNVIANLYTDGVLEGHILSAELKENVEKVLGSLKESYKSLIVFKYFMDLSYKEIGEILDLDENQVKTYLYRARNKFKEQWEGLKYGR